MTFSRAQHTMLERLAVSLAALVLVVCLPASALIVQIGTARGNAGETVRVPVTLETQGTEPAALDFRIQFSSSKMQFKGTADADDDLDGLAVVETAPGMLAGVALAGLDDIEDGTLFYLVFKLLPQVQHGETILVEGLSASAADTNAGSLTASIRSGWVFAGVCPVPSPPAGLNATGGAFSDKVMIFWEPALYATRYKVFRASSPSGGFDLIGTTSARFFEDSQTSRLAPAAGGGCSGPAATLDIASAFYYRVVASNACGDSPPAGPVTGSAAAKSFEHSVSASSMTLVPFLAAAFSLLALRRSVHPR
jgi:hypothetical protein